MIKSHRQVNFSMTWDGFGFWIPVSYFSRLQTANTQWLKFLILCLEKLGLKDSLQPRLQIDKE